MVLFSCNGAALIFSHLLVLTYERNCIGFIEQFPEKALETMLFYASLYVFPATAGAAS